MKMKKLALVVFLALMITQIRNRRLQRVTQTITYMPHFISTVVMASIIIMFLSPNNGLYGHIVRAFGGSHCGVGGGRTARHKGNY